MTETALEGMTNIIAEARKQPVKSPAVAAIRQSVIMRPHS